MSQDPQELLELFAKLEAENLALIQECQEAEARLGEGKEISVRTRTELNQQAANLEAEIRQLEVINLILVCILNKGSVEFRCLEVSLSLLVDPGLVIVGCA